RRRRTARSLESGGRAAIFPPPGDHGRLLSRRGEGSVRSVRRAGERARWHAPLGARPGPPSLKVIGRDWPGIRQRRPIFGTSMALRRKLERHRWVIDGVVTGAGRGPRSP